mgnify:CR=1 FL=1
MLVNEITLISIFSAITNQITLSLFCIIHECINYIVLIRTDYQRHSMYLPGVIYRFSHSDFSYERCILCTKKTAIVITPTNLPVL